MESNIEYFAGKRVRYREYGAGAEIVELNNTLVADFPNHIDAEEFMKLLSTKVYLVIEEMDCDCGKTFCIEGIYHSREKADKVLLSLREDRDTYKYPRDWFVEEHEINA